jgi:anthranilate synthase component 1
MALGFNFSKQQFLDSAELGRIIPITLKIFGGNETPIGIYEKFSRSRTNTFLLESAEQGVWSRFSFIGINSRATITQNSSGLLIDHPELVLPSGTTSKHASLDVIEEIQSSWKAMDLAELPPLTSGLVGFFAWDTINEIEKLPTPKGSAYKHPVMQLQLVRDIAVIDHMENAVLLISNIYCDDTSDYSAAYDQAIANLESLFQELSAPSQSSFSTQAESQEFDLDSNTTEKDFLEAVAKAKEFVRIGDVFQVVISQRFQTSAKASPLDIYRVLRSINPSPYMYLLNLVDGNGPYSIVGSSPEALVKIQSQTAVMHPIAGSRPRGVTPQQDNEFEQSLLNDAKEKAEHLMLVDLARNDLLKVCEPDSISVTEFMKVHRFSHVMHLVSTVEGKMLGASSATDVLRATFPAGTLSGAPKPRALEIIAELEPDNRGIFGGVVGYLDFAGNTDLAIAIRSAFIRDGKAFVQAGAGIVLDSDPQSEFKETVNKASAVLRAIEQANRTFGK